MPVLKVKCQIKTVVGWGLEGNSFSSRVWPVQSHRLRSITESFFDWEIEERIVLFLLLRTGQWFWASEQRDLVLVWPCVGRYIGSGQVNLPMCSTWFPLSLSPNKYKYIRQTDTHNTHGSSRETIIYFESRGSMSSMWLVLWFKTWLSEL